MLNISGSTESKAQPGEGGVGVGSSRAGRNWSRLNRSKIDNGEVDSGKVRDDKVGKKVQKLSKSKNLAKSQKTVRSDFLTNRV